MEKFDIGRGPVYCSRNSRPLVYRSVVNVILRQIIHRRKIDGFPRAQTRRQKVRFNRSEGKINVRNVAFQRIGKGNFILDFISDVYNTVATSIDILSRHASPEAVQKSDVFGQGIGRGTSLIRDLESVTSGR